MSELKVGDVVFYEGNRGIVRHIFNDGKENYYKIELTITSPRFLYADELDLMLEQPTINENQQIVLGWLKAEELKNPLCNSIIYICSLYNSFIHHALDDKTYYAYEALNEKELTQVLQAFSQWVLEQEEE